MLDAIEDWQLSSRESLTDFLFTEGQSCETYNVATSNVYANWENGVGNLLGDKPEGTGYVPVRGHGEGSVGTVGGAGAINTTSFEEGDDEPKDSGLKSDETATPRPILPPSEGPIVWLTPQQMLELERQHGLEMMDRFRRAYRVRDPNVGWLPSDLINALNGIDTGVFRDETNSVLRRERIIVDYLDPEVRARNEAERSSAERNGKTLVLPPLPPFDPDTNFSNAHFEYPMDSSGKCWPDGRTGGMPPTSIYVPGQHPSGGTKLTIVANKGHVYVIVETPDGHTHSYGAYPGGTGIGNVEIDSDLKWPDHAVNSIRYVLSANQERALASWVNTPWTYINQIVRINRRVCIDYAEDTMDVVLRADSKLVDGELGWPEGLPVADVIAEIERRKDYRREFQKRNPGRQPVPAPPIRKPSGGGGKTK
jgi:hypothetical protein